MAAVTSAVRGGECGVDQHPGMQCKWIAPFTHDSAIVAIEQRDANIEPGAQPTAGPLHTLKMGDVRLVCPHTTLSVTAQSADCLLFVGSAKDVEADIASALDAAWEAPIA